LNGNLELKCCKTGTERLTLEYFADGRKQIKVETVVAC
jgi:hypothetical protein